MQERTIVITEQDMKRLRQLVFDYGPGEMNSPYLKNLTTELDRAAVVNAQNVPRDVVTMNSKVRVIDLDTNEELTYTLVFPEDADVGMGKISVLAPIGTALLGYRVGDEFEWHVPDGVARLKVIDVLDRLQAVEDTP